MQLSHILEIERKELTLFFTTPIGYLFLGLYLLATLFVFFWVETFFARNIADVAPMFAWLPVSLIFLTSALTMRMWSEERRAGTLEFVATLPVSSWDFVLGKFFACWSLLGVALLLTLPLPITVSLLGDLDWGPVFAGYVAAMLLGASYIAIGLFVSAGTNSQIVSLIGSALICGVFYLLGSSTIAELFGGNVRDTLTAVGSGARFESITRGVLDVRDLYFYGSIAAVFLALNVYRLERGRWASDGDAQHHRKWHLGTGVLVLNLLLANVWLSQVNALRFDMTEGRIYSISDATRSYLRELREPLLIRGYFSEKTHPLLAPLVPQLKNLLEEYEVAGAGQVRVEIVDPAADPEIENEANTKYGIRSVPFQIQDRHQASLVNSYLDVLIQYGDEYEVLGFRDLIEVKVLGEADLDIRLKNPEFDVTRSIKRVLYGFQGGSSVFENIVDPVQFVGYVSDDAVLPLPLVELKQALNEALRNLQEQGGSKFSSQVIDPAAGDGHLQTEIAERFGFQPMAASLFDENTFYFYLTLQQGDTVVQVGIPEALTAEAVQRNVEEGLKRFAAGLLRRVVLAAPQSPPPYMQQQGMPRGNDYTQLQGALEADFEVTLDDLSGGSVDADLVMVVDPSNFTEQQVFALDQYLMKGGTVVVASGAFGIQFAQTGFSATPRQSGLDAWLAHHGVTVGANLVMDPQNAAFPVPVTRQVGGFSFQDLVMLDYPYFVDIRDAGLGEDLPVLAGIGQITMSWASPLEIADDTGVERFDLLRSSAGSWLSSSADVSPQVGEDGLSPFEPQGTPTSQLLGVALQGQFSSYFAGQQSPLLRENELKGNEDDPAADPTEAESDAATDTDGTDLGTVSSVIEKSPESARLLVFGSNDFLADQILQMIGSSEGVLYANSLQMMTNVVDWAVEDQALISIRSRGHFNRTLPGMTVDEQSTVEYINYALALLGVGLVLVLFRVLVARRKARQQQWLTQGAMGGQA